MPVLACPVCGSHQSGDYLLVGIALHNGTTFEIRRCKAHRIGFADKYPRPEQVDAIRPVLDAFYGQLQPESEDPRSIDFLDRVMRVVPAGGVLHDVGCGNGQLMAEATRRGWAVQGNDIVPAVSRDTGMAFFVGRLPELTLTPNSCDAVTSYCVLPHCTDPRGELAAVYRLLKPGGWLVAELPSDGIYRRTAIALYRMSGGRWPSVLAQIYQPGGHQFTFDPQSIQILLQAVGFDEVRADPFFQSPGMSLMRFRERPLWVRMVATVAVRGLALCSRLLNRPNHMIVYAQKPAH
ncbi:MAG: class I SAM-dependent methyltransferase [Candidatus Dormibacteraeota bacterium]|nr:class I SAM-dependent methyltransferase [Candidatus Dormibacteraeota bacterium]